MNVTWQFVFVLIFGTACWGTGNFILQFFCGNTVFLSPLARYTLAFCAGNIAFSYLLTALGFAGFFIKPVIWGIFFVGAGLTVYRLTTRVAPQTMRVFQGPGEQKRNISSFGESLQKEECQGSPAGIWVAVVIGLFLFPAILQAAAPPYVRDSLVYHLLCPKEYLRVGRLIHIEGNLYSAFPKGHEVLMTLLLATAGDRAAQALAILQELASVGALFSLSRLVAGPWAAGICTLGYATVPPAIYFAGCGYVEPALLMALGSSLLALVLFVHPTSDGLMPGKLNFRKSAFIGLLAGWMPALKYTGMIYLGLMAILLLWSQRKEPVRETLKIIGVFALGAAPGLCWLAWNWMNLGNPVYPLAYSFFGGKGWDDVRDRAMSLYFHGFGMGREARDYLLLPWRFSFSGRFDSAHFDGAMGPFLLIFLTLAAASAIRMVRRPVNQKMLGGMGFVLLTSVVFFIVGNQQARFWLPSQFLACFYAAPIVAFIHKWARSRRFVNLVIGLAAVASLAWNGWFLIRQVVVVGYHKPVLGWEEESSFLKRIVLGYPAMEFVNQHVPLSSRVFCVWTGAYGYYLDRPYYSDTFLEDVTFRRLLDGSNDEKDLSQKLAKSGFTHLFVRRSWLEDTMTPRQREIFVNFLKKESRELFHHRDFSVLAVSLN